MEVFLFWPDLIDPYYVTIIVKYDFKHMKLDINQLWVCPPYDIRVIVTVVGIKQIVMKYLDKVMMVDKK